MKRLYIISAIWCLTISSCQRQIDDPLAVVKTVFAKDYVLDLNKDFTKEYKMAWSGTPPRIALRLPYNCKTNFFILGRVGPSDTTAVINVTITDSTGREHDLYVHLVKDSVWKINAVEGLRSTEFIYREKKCLEGLSETQIDSIVEASKKDPNEENIFKSRDEYEFKLGNDRLILASDNEIITHFKKNKQEFEKLKDDFIAGYASKEIRLDRSANKDKLRTQLNKLYLRDAEISSFYQRDASPNSPVEYNLSFVVGGTYVGYTVAYMYVDNEFMVPHMKPKGIIMIRRIEDHWFLYKTNGSL